MISIRNKSEWKTNLAKKSYKSAISGLIISGAVPIFVDPILMMKNWVLQME